MRTNLIVFILGLSMATSAAAQDSLATKMTIVGTVIDEDDLPVSNAIVSVSENPDQRVMSDQSGKFVIQGALGQQLNISKDKGSTRQEIDNDTLAVKLSGRFEQVHIGFGILRDKRQLTSAIGTADYKSLNKRYAIHPTNALYGQIPGLTALQNGGASWESDPNLFIRGLSTFADGRVLVLVDGFERPLSSLSLGEIESVSILKDGAALALFGQRGANGVLMISTKQGNAQRPSVEVSYEYGITKAFRLPKFFDAYRYASALNEARVSDGLAPSYSESALDAFRSQNSPYFYPNVDWVNTALRRYGLTDNFMASFQNRNKGVRYFALINYQRDRGLFDHVNENEGYSTQLVYSKFNFRTNIDIDVTRSTNLLVSLSGNLRETRMPGVNPNVIMNSIYTTPSAAYPVRTFDDNWGGTSLYSTNPLARIASSGYRFDHVRELMANMSISQRLDLIAPGLLLEGTVAFDNAALYNEGKLRAYQYESLNLIEEDGRKDTVSTLYGENTELQYFNYLGSQWRRFTARANLSYQKAWGASTLDAALVYQIDRYISRGQSNVYSRLLGAASVHYAYAGKYFADFTLSSSGTGILPAGARFGWFPALSVGWNIAEESWFSKSRPIDYLKLRGSWGLAGNDILPLNLAISPFVGAAGYFFSPNNSFIGGLREGRLRTANLTYEISSKANVGVDLSIQEKFSLNADVFYDHRKNILINTDASIADVLGAERPLTSSGVVTNKGIELGAAFHENKERLKYFVSGQFSFTRNKIIEQGEVFRPYDNMRRTGQPIGQAFGLESIGFFRDSTEITESPAQIFSSLRPGDIKYEDTNGDGRIDAFDERAIGYSTLLPEINYAASLGFEFQGFGFQAMFQGIANKTLFLNTASIFWPIRAGNTISEFWENGWSSANAENATLPRLSTLDNDNNYRANSIWLRNGSYLKLRTAEVYYAFPNALTKRLKLAQAKVWIRGTDLFSIDQIKIMDPEAIGLQYPTLAIYSVGFNVGF